MESINSEEATKQQIRTSIKKIAGMYELDVVEIINCTVVSVDKAKRNCIVKALSGKSDTNIENVGLMMEVNDGEFKIPAVGSTVGVVISTLVSPYLIGWSDLDEWYIVIGTTTIDVLAGSIKFGDGSFGGIVKIDNLKTQWDANVTAIKAACVASFTTVDAAIVALGGASTSVATFNGLAGQIQNLTKASLENADITHGTT